MLVANFFNLAIYLSAWPNISVAARIGLELRYYFHQLISQCFSGEHLGSFLAGTRRLEQESIQYSLWVDPDNAEDLRPDQ